MVVRCAKDSLNIHTQTEVSAQIAARFNCSPFQASLLEMRGLTADVMPKEVENWLSPYLPRLLEKLDLGADNANAAALVRGLGPSSDVVVYGDYDVDGISATAIAMELALSKGAHVRYFIPHRFNQGYGLHKDVAQVIAKRKCDLVIVVDCGTQDVESVEILKKNGIPVVIFDHHLVEGKRAESDTLVNPQICGDSTAKRLCATAVLWCWIWQNELMPRRQLMKLLDVVALATIADCVSLSSSLNRALVREGINSIRSKARPGLNLLMEQLGISPSSIDTEDLAMRVIPCLNAAGRLYLADLAVEVLFPGKDLAGKVGKLIALNRKRRELSTKILEQVDKLADDKFRYVLTSDDWSVGVLSSVASRICGDRNAPVALAASVGGTIMRGTLRMPAGGDAVGVLKQLAPLLNTWGGHRLAAGFSVKMENWQTVREKMEEILSGVKVVGEKEELLFWNPANLDMKTWTEASALGPFGMDNPAPMLYAPYNGKMSLTPLGKGGKHVKVSLGPVSLLAFGAADMFSGGCGWLDGWVYKPRLDTWRNVTSLQFVLEKMVARESKTD